MDTEEKKILKEVLENEAGIARQIKEILLNQQRILQEILHEEHGIKKEEDVLKVGEETIESAEKQIESLIKKRVVRRNFTDISEWKRYVWDTCTYKKDRDVNKEIFYLCEKTGKECRFAICPVNLY
jgi:hypothetical protein